MLRRTAWAAAAFRCGLAEAVIPSGGRAWPVASGPSSGHAVEAEVMRRCLVAQGVPDAQIFPERLSLTTVENALFTARQLRHLGARRALIATCEWHMPRALSCFRAAGVEALPVIAPAPPAPLLERVHRRVRERVSRALDDARLRSLASLRDRGAVHPYDEVL